MLDAPMYLGSLNFRVERSKRVDHSVEQVVRDLPNIYEASHLKRGLPH